jgi:ferredoxin
MATKQSATGRHCEEHSDEAIQKVVERFLPLIFYHKRHKGFTKNCRASALCALCAFVVKNDKKAVKNDMAATKQFRMSYFRQQYYSLTF